MKLLPTPLSGVEKKGQRNLASLLFSALLVALVVLPLTIGTVEALTGNVLPSSDDTYDVGSTSLRWRDLYLGPTSLHLYCTAAECTTARDWKLAVQEGATGEGNLRIMLGTSDFINIEPDGDVGIGTTGPGGELEVYSNAASGPELIVHGGSSATNTFIRMNGDYTGINEWELRTGTGGFFIQDDTNTRDVINLQNDGDVILAGSGTGNVGIGDSTPTEGTLVVAGTIYATTQATAVNEAVLGGRNLTAGAGLTGGGNLTADRTFNVGAGTDISVGVDAINNTSTLATVTGRGASTTTQLAFNYNAGSPFTVLNSTVVTSLNADMVDGYHYSSSWPNPSNMITGSGTSGYVPKFTGTYTVGNSIIQDNGSLVTVGGDLTVSGETINLGTEGTLDVRTYTVDVIASGNMTFSIDSNNDQTGREFKFYNNGGPTTGTEIASLTEAGALQIDGDLTVSGGDIRGTSTAALKLRGDTNVVVHLEDSVASGTNYSFQVRNDADSAVFRAYENGRIWASSFNTSGSERLCWDGTGASYINDCSGSPGDIAEYYATRDPELEPGDIVSIDESNVSGLEVKAYVKHSDTSYDHKVIGIVSTEPYDVMGDIYEEKENPSAIALVGRVLTKVSTINGLIQVGDPITSSEIPGVGMKATKAGPIVGKALADYDNPDPNAVGKIMVFVNVSWYDPDVYLTSSGGLKISTQMEQTNTDQTDGAMKNADITDTESVSLTDAEGNLITRIGAFSEVATAYLKAGRVEVQKLSIGGRSLDDYLFSRISELTGENGRDSSIELSHMITEEQTLIDTEGDLAQVNTNGTQEKIETSDKLEVISVKAEEGIFEKIRATIEAIFDHVKAQALDVAGKITAKTAEIGEVISDHVKATTLNVTSKLEAVRGIFEQLTVKKLAVEEPTIGEATIPKGEKEILITNSSITNYSKIFITFTSDYAPATRFWIAEQVPGYFVVKLDAPVAADAEFNWWIVEMVPTSNEDQGKGAGKEFGVAAGNVDSGGTPPTGLPVDSSPASSTPGVEGETLGVSRRDSSTGSTVGDGQALEAEGTGTVHYPAIGQTEENGSIRPAAKAELSSVAAPIDPITSSEWGNSELARDQISAGSRDTTSSSSLPGIEPTLVVGTADQALRVLLIPLALLIFIPSLLAVRQRAFQY